MSGLISGLQIRMAIPQVFSAGQNLGEGLTRVCTSSTTISFFIIDNSCPDSNHYFVSRMCGSAVASCRSVKR